MGMHIHACVEGHQHEQVMGMHGRLTRGKTFVSMAVIVAICRLAGLHLVNG